jgi:hypothetical protein
VIIFITALILWIKRGDDIGKSVYFEGKKNIIQGRIIMMERTSQEKKFVKIQFADSTWYDVPFFGFEEHVQIGDSIYKKANTYQFMIFKKSNPNDTAFFKGSNNSME